MGKPFAFIMEDGTAVKADILDGYAVKNSPRQIPEDAYTGSYGTAGRGLMAPPYKLEALALLPEANTYHMRCCRTKARDTAGIGWEIVPSEAVKEGQTANEGEKALLEAFFRGLEVPITQTAQQAQYDDEAIGNGYIELVTADDGVTPTGLYHIPGHTMRIHKSGMKAAQVRGTKLAWFKVAGYDPDVNYKNGQEGVVTPDLRATQVLRIRTYTSRSDYYGIPEAITALGAIQGHLAQRDYNLAFFRNFGIPAYAVHIEGDYDLGDYVNADGEVVPDGDATGQYALIRTIQRYFEQVQRKPHSSLVFAVPSATPEGKVEVKIEPLAVDVKEASFTIYRKDNRDEVLSAHGVPPYRAGIAETGSLGGSTAEESTKIYRDSVINPRQADLEHLINTHVVWGGFECYDWQFKFKEIDLAEEDHDLSMLGALFALGAASPADVIRAVGGKFGIEVPLDESGKPHPLMEAHWLGGVPITGPIVGAAWAAGGTGFDPQAVQAVKAMQEQLLSLFAEEQKAAKAKQFEDTRIAVLSAEIESLRSEFRSASSGSRQIA